MKVHGMFLYTQHFRLLKNNNTVPKQRGLGYPDNLQKYTDFEVKYFPSIP